MHTHSVEQFADLARQVKCRKCLPGTAINATGSSKCTPCAEGKYKSTEGAKTCDACSVGEFAATTAQTKCAKCPLGHTNTVDNACEPCPKGTGHHRGRPEVRPVCCRQVQRRRRQLDLRALSYRHSHRGDQVNFVHAMPTRDFSRRGWWCNM